VKRTRISKLEIPAPLPFCDSPRIPQLSRASTFQPITKSYNTDYKNGIKTQPITSSRFGSNKNTKALLVAAKLGETPVHGHP
jgi:hypothetical protein